MVAYHAVHCIIWLIWGWLPFTTKLTQALNSKALQCSFNKRRSGITVPCSRLSDTEIRTHAGENQTMKANSHLGTNLALKLFVAKKDGRVEKKVAWRICCTNVLTHTHSQVRDLFRALIFIHRKNSPFLLKQIVNKNIQGWEQHQTLHDSKQERIYASNKWALCGGKNA